MEQFDKIKALEYLTGNNPLCDGCSRSNLEEIRIAAGLYEVVKEILSEKDERFDKDFLDQRIQIATSF